MNPPTLPKNEVISGNCVCILYSQKLKISKPNIQHPIRTIYDIKNSGLILLAHSSPAASIQRTPNNKNHICYYPF